MRVLAGIVAIIVLPSLIFGTALALVSGDWLISYLVWPSVLVFLTLLYGTLWVLYLIADWAFNG